MLFIECTLPVCFRWCCKAVVKWLNTHSNVIFVCDPVMCLLKAARIWSLLSIKNSWAMSKRCHLDKVWNNRQMPLMWQTADGDLLVCTLLGKFNCTLALSKTNFCSTLTKYWLRVESSSSKITMCSWLFCFSVASEGGVPCCWRKIKVHHTLAILRKKAKLTCHQILIYLLWIRNLFIKTAKFSDCK